MSTLTMGSLSFPAFSGMDSHKNQLLSACIPNNGPIPPGVYYIFDRQSGGLLGPLKDLFSGKDEWFALYAIDNKIDDQTFCDSVKRGQFRLHPKGLAGISKGCITIEKNSDFQYLRSVLKDTRQEKVPGSNLLSYGKVTVR